MTVFKRGNVWWYKFMFQGQSFRVSSKSQNKKTAERLERTHKERLELGQGGLKPIKKPTLFSLAADDYLKEHKPHWAPKTHEIHTNSLVHLKKHFGAKLLTEITKEDVHAYQAKRKKVASNRTINIELALLRLVLGKRRWFELQDDGLKMLKEQGDIGRELSEDESHRLLTACKASASRSLYPAVIVSIHTGLRNHELRLLKWRQIDLIEGTLTVGKSKTEGGTGRLVYLSQTALAVLKEWHQERQGDSPEDAVWPAEMYGHTGGRKGQRGGVLKPYGTDPTQPIGSWNTAWRTAKKTAKVECRWHDLRHTFVSRVAAGGAMDQTVMALAGHLSRRMMEKYSHVRNAAKRQAVAVFDGGVVQ